MSDFFDRLERELRGAVARSAARAPAVRRRRRVPAGGLVVGLASVGAVVVAVIAIGVTGHGGSSGPAASHESACTRTLFADLGVLRRPQTAADRAFKPPRLPGVQQTHPLGLGLLSSGWTAYAPLRLNLVPGLTRLARTLPGRGRVFFVVYAPAGGARVPSGDQVWAYLTRPGRSSPTLLTDIISGAFLSAQLDTQPPTPVSLPSRSTIYLSVVPDGVARVVWTFPREVVPPFTAPGGKVFPGRVIPGGTLIATVRGNVAASRPAHLGGFPSTTLLAADGRVLSSAKAPVIRHTTTIPLFSPGTHTGTVTATATGVPLSKAC